MNFVDRVIDAREYFGDKDYVSLDVVYSNGLKKTFVFNGYEDMEFAAIENPSIPFSIWETLATMQAEFSAAKAALNDMNV